MEVWTFIKEKLSLHKNLILLWVVESEGSSPGRSGFKMAVSPDGSFEGTIGGGIMEHKLVEKARAMLLAGDLSVSVVRQHHDKQHAREQSGMICSGSQQVIFLPLSHMQLPLIENILYGRKTFIRINKDGIYIADHQETVGFNFGEDENWQYVEGVNMRPVIHIIGGGHVGLALSEMMAFLDYYIIVYDNRQALKTMEENNFAHEKRVVNYISIGDIIPSDDAACLVIMTFGYRDDKIVFRQLSGKEFFYAGMMGSEAKIKTLKHELEQEGIDPEVWKRWHMPIGLPILSKTTKEIAVSIAAEIIREKNKDLSTGRTLTIKSENK